MTARCQLCGITVTSRYIPKNATEPELLVEYDNLSAQMWKHIKENHPTQTLEGHVNEYRAARMYAMNWADHDQTMTHLKHQWRQQMLIGMTVTTRAEHETPEHYAADRHPNCSCGIGSRGACIVHSQAADAEAADPAGLNAKKSARKTSN